jgi:hypothetical protein
VLVPEHVVAGSFVRASRTGLLHGLEQPTTDVRDYS